MPEDVDFDAEQFLLSREQFGMRFGLERIDRLLDAVGRPDAWLPAVHVVGTNGKTSTARFTAAALGAQGLTVGTFTSPHLRGFRERITVAGAHVTGDRMAAASRQVQAAVSSLDAVADDDDRVTQFEAVWAVALCVFRAANCDAIVAEAGLGGRLDATNVLRDARVQVLTGIALDHTDLLGETVEEIAAEKLAVVRQGGVLVIGRLAPAVRAIAVRVALEHGAKLEVADAAGERFAPIHGGFMRDNAALALAAAAEMFALLGRERRPRFDREAAIAAIFETAESGLLYGRLTVEGHDPLVVFDCAHNARAAQELAAAMAELAAGRPLTLVLAVLADKRVDELARPLLAEAASAVCTQCSNPRSLAAGELAARVRDLSPGLPVSVAGDPCTALAEACAAAGPAGAVLVAGSNYLIADLVRDDRAGRGATF